MRVWKPILISALFASLLVLGACKPVTKPAPAVAEATTDSSAAVAPIILRFDADRLHTGQEGSVLRGERIRYSLETQDNEYLQVYLTALEQNAALTIIGPDGAPLPGTEEGTDATAWSGVVPSAGEYIIEVGSTRGNAAYRLSVGVDPSTYQPIPADACQTIKADAESALNVTFAESEGPFYDYANQEGGTGCVLTATGNGNDFVDPLATIDALKAAMPGWEEDMAYAAGGPMGAAIGLTRDQGLMLISADWRPAADANCPADQPIAACELTPEQKLYTVTIAAAMK